MSYMVSFGPDWALFGVRGETDLLEECLLSGLNIYPSSALGQLCRTIRSYCVCGATDFMVDPKSISIGSSSSEIMMFLLDQLNPRRAQQPNEET
jgi:hypothetical protein